eukprot:1154912-Pelagomonas_calceolata.AAC.1
MTHSWEIQASPGCALGGLGSPYINTWEKDSRPNPNTYLQEGWRKGKKRLRKPGPAACIKEKSPK